MKVPCLELDASFLGRGNCQNRVKPVHGARFTAECQGAVIPTSKYLSQMEAPLVTAIIGNYNQEHFVIEALESVRAQTYPNVQVIVFDDCSTDNSIAVIEDWIERHRLDAAFIKHSKNIGMCASLNEVLPQVQGKYVSIVAADDIWLPEKLSRQVTLIEQVGESASLVYSDCYLCTEDGNLLPGTMHAGATWAGGPPSGFVFDILVRQNFIPAATALIRKDSIESIGGYDERICIEDWNMWLKLALKYKVLFSPYISAIRRIVPTSMEHGNLRGMAEGEHEIMLKWIDAEHLSAEARDAVKTRLINTSITAYRYGSTRSTELLANARQMEANRRLTLLHLCSGLGLPFSVPGYVLKLYAEFRRFAFRSTIGRLKPPSQ